MSRYFVAVWPPPEVVRALADLPRVEGPRLRWTTPEQWHMTLRYLGDVDEGVARGSLNSLEAAATEVVLGPGVERLDSHTIVVPASGLDDLAAAVQAVTGDIGEPPHPAGFRGHLTLARQRVESTTSLDGHPVAARFTVDEIALVRSELHPDGARYTTVARRSLSS